MGCVAPAVPSKLGWVRRHCWKNGVKLPLFCSFVLSATPKLGEMAKVYRWIDRPTKDCALLYLFISHESGLF